MLAPIFRTQAVEVSNNAVDRQLCLEAELNGQGLISISFAGAESNDGTSVFQSASTENLSGAVAFQIPLAGGETEDPLLVVNISNDSAVATEAQVRLLSIRNTTQILWDSTPIALPATESVSVVILLDRS